MIYGGVDAQGIVFDGVDEALRVPNTDLRLFGKPESFVKRRMGVALALRCRCGRGAHASQAGGLQSQAAHGLNQEVERKLTLTQRRMATFSY